MKVESSVIDRISFRRAVLFMGREDRLYITFKDGSRYFYEGCPREIYEQLINAESIGKAFNIIIKPHFKGTKLA
jgi:hypothetical protein